MTTATVTRAFQVLAVELDTGTLFLAATAGTLGRDQLLPNVIEWGALGTDGTEIVIERDALPDEARGAWWTNREAAVLTVNPDAQGVYDGTILFDGVLAGEPDDEGGLLRLRLIPPRRRVVAIPDYGLITADIWPLAADTAMGQVKPLIVGTVEDCPLLPVRLPAATRLAADALPGAGQLDVDDAASLPAPGTVMVDGVAYAYDAKSAEGNTLLGVTVTGSHRQGTAVVTAGDTVFLAAGHACAAISDVRADGSPISGGTANLAAATVTFAQPPLKVERRERFTLTAQFDQVGAGTTAQNAINAIRAITGTVSQSATSLPSGITAAAPGVIPFVRPSGRIVKGVYTVAFSVSIGSQIGWARVKIGNEVVWFLEPPASVLYAWTPATITFDDDSDVLPVVVEVAEGGSSNQVIVTIASASRVASLGNLDDANFAVLKGPSNLLWRADQTDAMPDRGPIATARLWVRWFANGAAALPTATVKFGGRTLGTLAQTQLPNSTLAQTIAVDVTSQGSAALPQQAISTVISGGTAGISHSSVLQQASITVPILKDVGAGVYRGYSPCPSFDGWSGSLGDIAFKFMITASSVADAENKWFSLAAAVEFLNAAGSSAAGGVTAQPTETIVPGSLYAVVRSTNWAPTTLRFITVGYSGTTFPMHSVAVAWNGKITEAAASVFNTPASGFSNPITAQSLGHSGTAVGVSNGAINFTVPAPPRVVDQLFDLSWVRSWADLIGQAEVGYTSGGPDLCLNQVALLVEYDAQVLARAETLTAQVTGVSGNPADVIALLADKTGQKPEVQALGRLRAWCVTNEYAYARRIAATADSLSELATALSQVNTIAGQDDGKLAPVRRLDFGREVETIREADLLAPARIGWDEQIENAITLRYRPGADSQYTRALVADASNNAWCRQSQTAIRETRAVQLTCDWLRDDATAARYLADRARLTARPRRTLTLPCTFATRAREGDLVEYLPLGAEPGEGIAARVTAVKLDGPWPTLTTDQILD